MSQPSKDIKKVEELISSDRLKEAIISLRLLTPVKDFKSKEKLDNIETNYNYLLRSLFAMTSGQKDSRRNKILNSLREDLYAVADDIKDYYPNIDSPLLFYTSRRLVDYSHLSYSEAIGRFLSADSSSQLIFDKDSKEYKEAISAKNIALKDLFSIVWTMSHESLTKEIQSIENVICDDDISFSLRGILIGSLILSALRSYDKAIAQALLKIVLKTNSEKIKARVLIGFVLIMNRYPSRIARDEEILDRFELLSDDSNIYNRLREVLYSLVRARGGNKFNHKLKEEILPGIRKLSPDIFNNLKDEEGKIDLERLEENPEWEKIMSESGLEKQLRKFSDMQSNGADMMLSMMEAVSHNSFFKEIDSWFRPFEEWEYERMELDKRFSVVADMFNLNQAMCDSDKFALISYLKSIPPQGADMLKASFEAQSEQLTEEMKSVMLHTSTPEFDVETYNYARTLFRFFSFFRAKDEFENPFAKALNFTAWPIIDGKLGESEIVSSVADYYFKQGFYEDAIREYKHLLNFNNEDEKIISVLYQKIGLALERMNQLLQALEYYQKAFTISSEDEWLAGKIVKLSKLCSQLDAIYLSALKKLHSKDKDNMKYLLPLAEYEISQVSKDGVAAESKTNYLARAVYNAPDDPEVIRLQIKASLASNTDQYAYNASELIERLKSNIELYWAGQLLTESMDSENTSSNISDQEREDMIKDEILILVYSLLHENFADAIEAILNVKKLLGRRIVLEDDLPLILNSYGNIKIPQQVFDYLPMILDCQDA